MTSEFRAESRWNPGGIQSDAVPDSALSQPASQQSKGQQQPVRDRTSYARGSADWLDSLAEVVAVIRPDWSVASVRAAIGRSKAAPLDVILNAIAAAADGSSLTPGRIEFYDRRQPTPIPPPYVAPRTAASPIPAEAHAAITAAFAGLKPLPNGRDDR